MSVSTTSLLLATCPRKLKFLEKQIISRVRNEMDKLNLAALSGTKVVLTGAQQTFYHFHMITILKDALDFLNENKT